MSYALRHRGGRWYHISEREGRRLTLTKASLGEFVYELLRHNGELHVLWPFQPTYPRSPVYPVVALTPEDRDAFCVRTGFVLVDPPEIKLA